jgi:hypothetical protein
LVFFLDPLARVMAEFRETFGEKIDRRKAHSYEASRPCYRRKIGKALCTLFDRTRAEFESQKMAVPIASKLWRLRSYQRCAERAEEMGNLVLVGEMCEHAAKECGGMFTNRRELGGPRGEAIPVNLPAVIEVPEMAKDMQDLITRYTPRSGHDD